jgi:hypothetical protein
MFKTGQASVFCSEVDDPFTSGKQDGAKRELGGSSRVTRLEWPLQASSVVLEISIMKRLYGAASEKAYK